MTLQVRRIVTGDDASGKAVVTTDERLTATAGPGRARCETPSTTRCRWTTRMWRTQRSAKASWCATTMSAPARVRWCAWSSSRRARPVHAPDGDGGLRHPALSGECDLELDDGATVHMTAGDIVVQRGTMHAWVNNGTQPCVFAFVLIDADPVNVAGQSLVTHYPV